MYDIRMFHTEAIYLNWQDIHQVETVSGVLLGSHNEPTDQFEFLQMKTPRPENTYFIEFNLNPAIDQVPNQEY